jgi:Domain of unknown function (DUF4328)
MEELKPNQDRAKYAIVLIIIIAILEFLALFAEAFQNSILQKYLIGKEVDIKTSTLSDNIVQILAIITLVCYVVSAVTFIMWFRRAYYNLHLRVENLSHYEGAAATSWFIPFINFARPYIIMKELYERSTELLKQKDLYIDSKINTNYIPIWWALWILNNVLGQISFRMSKSLTTIEEYLNFSYFNFIAGIISIILAIITIKVIKDYSEVEPLLIDMNDEVKATIESIGKEVGNS